MSSEGVTDGENTQGGSNENRFSTLANDQVERYSRHLLLQDGFGVTGQQTLLDSSVLVVGAGGIGSTVLLYLAALGIGTITVVDHDSVDISNLHRQVIHKSCNVGKNKAQSAAEAMLALNPTVNVKVVKEALTHDNTLEIVREHDVVVDASDNPKTRYLMNDACVLADKPLISGSAVGTQGQLSVYNTKQTTTEGSLLSSGCYRCLYPQPAASSGCLSCADAGVLGPVPGLIGILQAMETLKVLTNLGKAMDQRLLMYDALACSFVTVKKPKRSSKCPICGDAPVIKSMEDSRENLQSARGPSGVVVESACLLPSNKELPPECTLSCLDYNKIRLQGTPHLLLDVRVPHQFEMCHLPSSINIPVKDIQSKLENIQDILRHKSAGDGHQPLPVYCICRRGIASAEATRLLKEAIDSNQLSKNIIASVQSVVGGLKVWHEKVDSNFPKY